MKKNDIKKILDYFIDLIKDIKKQNHPFLLLINESIKQVQMAKAEITAYSLEQMKLISLYFVLQNLINNKIKGVDDKIGELISSDFDLFDKTFFELIVADYFLKNAANPNFIETRSKDNMKTADLLIDDTVEIECKKKDQLTDRDKTNNKFWEKMESNLNKWMDIKNVYYSIRVEIDNDLSKDQQDHIIQTIKTIIKKKQSCTGKNKTLGVNLDLQLLIYNQPIIAKGIHWEKDFSDNTDFFNIEFGMKALKGGNAEFSKIYAHSYKNKNQSDKMKGILNTINKAKKQFSKDRPSMIFINLNNLDKRMDDPFRKNLKSEIKHFFYSNSSITAIVLINDEIIPTQGKYRLNIEYLLNENARIKLPLKFIKILEKTKAKDV